MTKIMELSFHLLTILLLFTSVKLLPVLEATPSYKTDISALLSFKSQISGDPFGVLSSWNESLHHCKWQGVLCDRHHPDRVIALVLNSKGLSGSISPSLANLTFLHYINLSNNYLRGKIPIELGYLHRLHVLSMRNNSLEGSIPSTLGNCSKLKVINLGSNNLQGTIPSNLVQCNELNTISFKNNFLIGSIPPNLGNLTDLYILYLNQNRLTGFIPDTLGKLENLQWFKIYENSIMGEIPHSLYNISTMVSFDLGANKLEGTIPFNIDRAFPNLQNLLLYDNQLTGQIPPSITNCSALYDLELFSNYFSGIIPSTIGKLSNLRYFIVCINKLEAKTQYEWRFFDALTNCTHLQYLDLSSNQLQGMMPNSVANLSTSLLVLNISSSPIFGSIPIELHKLTNLNILILSNMLLSGPIPKEIGNLFKLGILDLSNNSLSGHIPTTFDNLTQMTQLYLNDNAFEGSIPPKLVNMQLLELLTLSNNKLIGKIPKEIMALPSLTINLDLSHNYLTDILPPEIGNLKNLQSIRLSNNKLLGEIPSTIGGCQLLQDLHLDNNLFQGTIPPSLSDLRGLQVFDVSNNSLSGQVPKFISQMNLRYLNISFNNFVGELPKAGIFMNITGIDVRGNPMICGGSPELHLPRCRSKSSTKSHHFHEKIVLIISIISSLIGCLIIMWLLVTCYSRKRSCNHQQTADIVLKHELKHVSYNDLLRATKNFSSRNLIGGGSFGKVYKAAMTFENVTTVAVKVLNLEKHGASRSFFSECEVLRYTKHRNLIKALSLCSSIDHQHKDFKALVFEYMPNGSLQTWLHPNSCIDLPAKTLNIFQRLSIAIDIAAALDYLHFYGPTPIVHCDLKPSNVLLDNDMTAKVSDFRLARFLVCSDTLHFQSITNTDEIKGSIGYIPPEYGMGGQPSVEGDVYSYGILLIEMFSGVSPTDERFGYGLSLRKYVEMALPERIMDVVDSNMFVQSDEKSNLYAPQNLRSSLVSVLQCGLLCSKDEPQERIVIKDVLKELDYVQKKLLKIEKMM